MAGGTIPRSAGVKVELLWANPSPDESFGAQNVSADLSDYAFYAVSAVLSTSNARSFGLSVFPADETENVLTGMNLTTNNNAARVVSYAAANGQLSFGVGRYNGAQNNSYMIPCAIYGIRL